MHVRVAWSIESRLCRQKASCALERARLAAFWKTKAVFYFSEEREIMVPLFTELLQAAVSSKHFVSQVQEEHWPISQQKEMR